VIANPEPTLTPHHVAVVEAVERLLRRLETVVQPEGAWMTVDQVAEELQCSRDTVTRLIQRGRLPAKDLGQGRHHNYRVRRADLAALDAAPAPKTQRPPRRRAAPYRRLA
jgi:excisionase family DNA binding protein